MKYFLVFLILIGFSGTAFAFHDEQTSRGVDDPKIAVSDSGVYVVWGEGSGPEFFDLLFAKSTDGGKTFDDIINLTNGISFYADPQIIVSENNVYVVWEDRISPDGIDSIFFTKSNDGGNSFDEPKVLDPVNDTENLIYRPIKMLESNDILYIFASFWDRQTEQHNMLLITSKDNGNTFSEPTILFESEQWDQFVDFTVDDNGIIYVLTDDKKEYDEIGDLNLRKIFSDGSMSDIIQVNGGITAATTSQLAVSGDNVYAAWRAWENGRWSLAFAKSNDGGNSFEEPKILNSDPTSIDIHGSDGSNIFAYGDAVYVKWEEIYWDGENQTSKVWTVISNNSGENFEVMVHPLNELLGEHGIILSVQEGENLYSMAFATKNPPFDNRAIYFAQSNDGKSYTEPVDVLESNPPDFRIPEIATSENSIHFVAEGNHDANCIMYIASHDRGKSFVDMKNLSPNGTPKQCLGIEEPVSSPLHQVNSGIDIEDIQCKQDYSKGFILALRERDGLPVCVTANSYDVLMKREWLLNNSHETIALHAAQEFIESSPTFSFDGIPGTIDLDITQIRKSIPPVITVEGKFQSSFPGYGDRFGQEFPHEENIYQHEFQMTIVQNNKIHKVIIDGVWNEITQKSITEDPKPTVHRGVQVGPTVSTVLTIGDPLNSKGLLPIIITEKSENVSGTVTFWQFQPIGYNGDNRGETWDIPPQGMRVGWKFLDDKGNEDIWDNSKIPSDRFAIPADLHGYTVICNGETRIGGESGHPSGIPIKPDIQTVYVKSGGKAILPDQDGIYTIQFVTLFETTVDLPNNVDIIENEQSLCVLENVREDATHAYYTKLKFKFDDQWTATYYSPEFKADNIHERAIILVKIFGDKFDFSQRELQLQDPQINFEPVEPDIIHRYSNDATLGFLFYTLKMKLTGECFVFSNGKEFCNDENYSLKFYVNNKKINDISEYIISENDKVLISYGSETTNEIIKQLAELDSMAQYYYNSLDMLMNIDIGTVKNGTYDGELGFHTVEKLFAIDMERNTEKNTLENTLSQKKYAHDILVQQNADQSEKESILNEIKQLESKLEDLSDKEYDYTTEEIFQKINEIEAENIKMHQLGPEEYKKLVTAKNVLEKQVTGESIPLVSIQINPDTAQLEVVLHKDIESNIAETEQYKSFIGEIIPDDVLWSVIFYDPNEN